MIDLELSTKHRCTNSLYLSIIFVYTVQMYKQDQHIFTKSGGRSNCILPGIPTCPLQTLALRVVCRKKVLIATSSNSNKRAFSLLPVKLCFSNH